MKAALSFFLLFLSSSNAFFLPPPSLLPHAASSGISTSLFAKLPPQSKENKKLIDGFKSRIAELEKEDPGTKTAKGVELFLLNLKVKLDDERNQPYYDQEAKAPMMVKIEESLKWATSNPDASADDCNEHRREITPLSGPLCKAMKEAKVAAGIIDEEDAAAAAAAAAENVDKSTAAAPAAAPAVNLQPGSLSPDAAAILTALGAGITSQVAGAKAPMPSEMIQLQNLVEQLQNQLIEARYEFNRVKDERLMKDQMLLNEVKDMHNDFDKKLATMQSEIVIRDQWLAGVEAKLDDIIDYQKPRADIGKYK